MKTIGLILLCLCLSACYAGKIQYGGATVEWIRFCDNENFEGLKIKAPDGTTVSIDKKSNEVQTQILSDTLAALLRAAAVAPVK